jgi:uncharacterized repeat protein (TIGR04138 family)
MQAANFDEALDRMLAKDTRYQRDAYLFVRESLDYTQKMVNKGSKTEPRQGAGERSTENRVRHVSGQELLAGIRAFAIEQFGPMALSVLQEWGVQRCEDFGEIVFAMVENNLLAKTKNDSRDDFKGGYDFAEAFRRPFLPGGSLGGAEPATQRSDPT